MKKKILCGLLVAAMMAGTMVSCGNSSDSGSTASGDGSTAASEGSEASEGGESAEAAGGYVPNFDEDPYTVKFLYLLAQEGDHFDEIQQAASDVTLSELNIQVELIPVTYGTIDSTLNTMLPAAEPLDVFTGFAGNASTYKESGYLFDWNDYADYLPNVTSWLSEADKDACSIGDFWVNIPSNFERCAWTCFLVRNDILEELGHTIDEYDGIDVTDMSSFDKLTDLFQEVKDNYPGMVGINGTMAMATQISGYVDGLADGFGVLENYGQADKVTNWYESDQWREICELNQEWFLKGFTSQDIVTQVDSIEPILKAGNTFAGICNAKPNTVPEKISQTGQDIGVIKLSSTMLSSGNFGNGFFLSSASEDPVKAAAWYNYIFASEDFNNIINWGLEGTDWVEKDGLATYPDGKDVNSVGYHNDYGWIYPNQMAGLPWEGNEVDIWDQYDDFNKGDYVSKAHGFRYDNSPVLNEVLACNTVQEQYRKRIAYGAYSTVEELHAAIDEFNAKLYEAGLQNIIDEKQKQLDEYLASKG